MLNVRASLPPPSSARATPVASLPIVFRPTPLHLTHAVRPLSTSLVQRKSSPVSVSELKTGYEPRSKADLELPVHTEIANRQSNQQSLETPRNGAGQCRMQMGAEDGAGHGPPAHEEV